MRNEVHERDLAFDRARDLAFDLAGELVRVHGLTFDLVTRLDLGRDIEYARALVSVLAINNVAHLDLDQAGRLTAALGLDLGCIHILQFDSRLILEDIRSEARQIALLLNQIRDQEAESTSSNAQHQPMWIARRLVAKAVLMLPASKRSRYLEEYRSELGSYRHAVGNADEPVRA